MTAELSSARAKLWTANSLSEFFCLCKRLGPKMVARLSDVILFPVIYTKPRAEFICMDSHTLTNTSKYLTPKEHFLMWLHNLTAAFPRYIFETEQYLNLALIFFESAHGPAHRSETFYTEYFRFRVFCRGRTLVVLETLGMCGWLFFDNQTTCSPWQYTRSRERCQE